MDSIGRTHENSHKRLAGKTREEMVNVQKHRDRFRKLKPGSLVPPMGTFARAAAILLLVVVFMLFSLIAFQNVGLN